ncbi:MAG: hypothetical protein ACI9VR_004133 [Cognaticolwellia sp.]|jgi:hypothetical protein
MGLCMPDHSYRSADTPSTAPAQTETSGPSTAPQRIHGGAPYTVQPGDTLWSIAAAHYGQGSQWPEIMQANPESCHRGGHLILIGDTLQLPPLTLPERSEETPSANSPSGGSQEAEPILEICTVHGNFTVYPDGVPLPPAPEDIEVLSESDYALVIAEREAATEALRAQTEEDVAKLLSYSWNDWAVTDADAINALALLGTLPLAQVQIAVANISDIGRLLDNLPAQARTGPAFSKLLIALGPEQATAHIASLLSTGALDWAVTDGDARHVMSVLSSLDSETRAAVLDGLSPDQQLTFVSNLPGQGQSLSGGDQAILRAMFYATDDANLELLVALFSKRFGLDTKGEDGFEWDAATLRRSWEVIEVLPASHVESNPDLMAWIRYGDTGNGGWYRASEEAGGFNIDPAKLDSRNSAADQAEDLDGDGVMDTAADPLYDVVRFNKVVRHEVGHAVDDRIGGSDRYCIGNAAGGNWSEYGSAVATVVSEMVAASGGGIDALDAGPKAAVLQVIVDAAAAGNADDLSTTLEALSEWATLSGDAQMGIATDPVISALRIALNSPWYNDPDGGLALGGRVFQRSYSSSWTSYAQSARAKKVSTYQFRAPGEWFAEAYATYYQPNSDGNADGSQLAGVDAATKAWFDTNVHTDLNATP